MEIRKVIIFIILIAFICECQAYGYGLSELSIVKKEKTIKIKKDNKDSEMKKNQDLTLAWIKQARIFQDDGKYADAEIIYREALNYLILYHDKKDYNPENNIDSIYIDVLTTVPTISLVIQAVPRM